MCDSMIGAESSATFLAIKRCQRTKFGKVIKLAQSSLKIGWISALLEVKLLNKKHIYFTEFHFSFKIQKQQIDDNKQFRQISGIIQWITSRASLNATGWCNWASACTVSSQRPPWSSKSFEYTKTLATLVVHENNNPNMDPQLSSLMQQVA